MPEPGRIGHGGSRFPGRLILLTANGKGFAIVFTVIENRRLVAGGVQPVPGDK